MVLGAIGGYLRRIANARGGAGGGESTADRQRQAAAMVAGLSDADRLKLFRLAAGERSLNIAVPDPELARLLTPGLATRILNTDVTVNGAGLRGPRELGPKLPGRHRLVFLGDSYVFGHGVEAHERFGDQVEDYLREAGVRPGGDETEVLSIGLSGWNLAQELAYIIPRLSEVEPDTLVMVICENDVAPNLPFSNGGVESNRYSPEQRVWGSGFFADYVNQSFGDVGGRTFLMWLDTPTGREIWQRAVGGLKRLQDLQAGRGGRFMISAMNPRGDMTMPFIARFEDKLRSGGVTCPYLPVTFIRSEETSVPGDTHPNALGHRILRDQYLRAFDELGWIALPDGARPDPDPDIPFGMSRPVDRTAHDDYLEKYRRDCLVDAIDFTQLEHRLCRTFMGGILAHDLSPGRQLDEPPWASVRAGFGLKLHSAAGARLSIDVDVPARPELFPMHIEMTADGGNSRTYELGSVAEAGRHTLEMALGPPSAHEALEVVLHTRPHFSTLDDNRMKCFRLIAARVVEA